MVQGQQDSPLSRATLALHGHITPFWNQDDTRIENLLIVWARRSNNETTGKTLSQSNHSKESSVCMTQLNINPDAFVVS